jgi:peptide/nickel transport system permease protein
MAAPVDAAPARPADHPVNPAPGALRLRLRLATAAVVGLAYAVLMLWSVFGGADSTPSAPEVVRAGGSSPTFDAEVSRVQTAAAPYAPCSWCHWLGTDDTGQDLLRALARGACTNLVTALLATAVYVVCGASLGVATGYGSGRWCRVVLAVEGVVGGFPLLLSLLLAVILVDACIDVEVQRLRVYALMAVFGALNSPRLAGLVRGRVLALKQETFIEAATALGLRRRQIVARHILYHECGPLLWAQAAALMGQAILTEATLTYLGFGLEYPAVSWGLTLRNLAGGVFAGHYHIWVVMLAITIAVAWCHSVARLITDYRQPAAERG